ncbi:hypothetical protein DV36_00960 [Amycolatopsis mediterranei]|nr:hypothetical protein DV36_00960 [Amycolatopsis mediterranei]
MIDRGCRRGDAGFRPVLELMYLDFIGVCLDQLTNEAAKLRFMTGGAVASRWSCARSSARAGRRAAQRLAEP